MNIKIITPVATEPLTTAEVKTHLRIDTTAEDTYIAALISIAREWAENYTKRALATQTLEIIYDDFPYEKNYIKLPISPLQSVTSIKYKDSSGTEYTWDTGEYVVNADSMPARIYLAYGKTFPVFVVYPTAGVRIRGIFGHSAGVPIPASIKHAMLLLIGHLYENREATVEKALAEVPFAVKSLLGNYKLGWW